MKKFLSVLFFTGFAVISLAGVTAMADESDTAVTEKVRGIENLLKDKNYEAALAATTKATRDNPKSWWAYYLLGRTQFYRGQDAEAQAALDKAIELNATYADTWFFRGLSYAYVSQPEKARTDFEKATELSPNEPNYWFELGKLNERTGKSDAAIVALEKVVLLNPKKAAAWFALGTLASDKGDYAKAAEMWEKTLQIDPNYIDAHYNLGLHHQLRGDPKISLSHFLAVYKLQPKSIEVVKKVIQAYYRLEDYKNANIYRKKLLELIAKSGDPETRKMREFCFDQFDAPGGRFFVYETIDKKGEFFNWFTFKLVNSDGKVAKTINLEVDRIVKEREIFFLGQNQATSHITFTVAFEKVPPYPELKQWVLKANIGQVDAASSSSQSPK